MFLTRIGFGAKAVVNGDVTQIDLARGQKSGLIEARRILGVRGIAFTQFGAQDVVRHPLVARIIDAYDSRGPGRIASPFSTRSPVAACLARGVAAMGAHRGGRTAHAPHRRRGARAGASTVFTARKIARPTCSTSPPATSCSAIR